MEQQIWRRHWLGNLDTRKTKLEDIIKQANAYFEEASQREHKNLLGKAIQRVRDVIRTQGANE